MSESDSDSAPAGNAGNGDLTLFPVDNQFYSQKDKREIMAMSEVQRESILAERAGLRDRQAQDQQLRRLLQAREKADAKPDKKRKAGTAELEDSPARKSSRQKTTLGGRKVGETSGAIEAYKRQREEKGLRDEQRRLEGEERRRKLRDSPLEKYSEADADGESEVEWDGRAKSAQPTRDEEPAQLIDFEHVRVGRDNFAKVCFYPGFDHAITNCYARVSIGPDRVTGENVYRMATIKGTSISSNCVTLLTQSRLYGRQTIRYGWCERQALHNLSICCDCLWKSRKAVAIYRLLQCQIHGGM